MRTNVEHLNFVDFFAHNDMDMMEIGNGKGNLTIQEERTHFAVWAFMKSPILLGTDVCGPPVPSVATSLNAIIGRMCSFLNSPLRRSRLSRTGSFSRSIKTRQWASPPRLLTPRQLSLRIHHSSILVYPSRVLTYLS